MAAPDAVSEVLFPLQNVEEPAETVTIGIGFTVITGIETMFVRVPPLPDFVCVENVYEPIAGAVTFVPPPAYVNVKPLLLLLVVIKLIVMIQGHDAEMEAIEAVLPKPTELTDI